LFERIAIPRQSRTGAPIDLGLLAECLLFYGKVRILADQDLFKYLVRCCGPDELLELISMQVLELEFFENITGVGQILTNIGPVFELVVVDSQPIRFPQVSRKIVDELAGPSGKGASKMYQRFQHAVERSRYTPEMLAQSHADLLDKQYLAPAIKSVLSLLAPEYKLPEPFVFRLEPILKGGTYKVTTNVDFDAANESANKHAAADHQSGLTVAYLLAFIADTGRDLTVGSRDQSEFAMAPERAVVASYKFAEILSAAAHGLEIAEAFQESVVDGVPSIRDAVNSGKRTFREVIQLLPKAEKFKDWLRKQGATEDLRSAYLKEVAHLDWADKLPPKSLRWLLISAAGLGLGAAIGATAVGTAAGLALSAGDTFLLDRLLKGWKPNQFIEGPLKQFLRFEK
jgi:hypothetical protein